MTIKQVRLSEQTVWELNKIIKDARTLCATMMHCAEVLDRYIIDIEELIQDD